MTEDLLYIPDFLRSTKGKQKNMSINTTKKALHIPPSPYAKKPPKRRALIGAGLCDIYLEDEMPRIGSGHRLLWFRKSRKWTHFSDMHGTSGRMLSKNFDRRKRINIMKEQSNG
tara:strand:- start:2422 stop:2763 length:342 start_codon:yes stop_codon:yes gene_type:complete